MWFIVYRTVSHFSYLFSCIYTFQFLFEQCRELLFVEFSFLHISWFDLPLVCVFLLFYQHQIFFFVDIMLWRQVYSLPCRNKRKLHNAKEKLSMQRTTSAFLMIYLVFQDKYTTNFRFIVERVSSNILNKIFKRTVYLEAIAYFLLWISFHLRFQSQNLKCSGQAKKAKRFQFPICWKRT